MVDAPTLLDLRYEATADCSLILRDAHGASVLSKAATASLNETYRLSLSAGVYTLTSAANSGTNGKAALGTVTFGALPVPEPAALVPLALCALAALRRRSAAH